MSADYTDDEILDGLESPPPPKPPAPHRLPVRVYGLLELAAVAVVSIALAVGLTAWWLGPRDAGPVPSPTPNAAALGRSYAPKLVAALAAGFEADADALHAGQSFGEADQALKKTFHDANAAAFEAHAGKALTALIPDKTEIKDQAQRAALEAFHRDFARGLKGGR